MTREKTTAPEIVLVDRHWFSVLTSATTDTGTLDIRNLLCQALFATIGFEHRVHMEADKN
jgi:hypothetical protein